MNYYFWVNGYENAGIVKADNITSATHKVIMSQGKCESISSFDEISFDNYDVSILMS